MTETLAQGQTIYEAGRSFYTEAISTAGESLEKAETPFETIKAKEDLELSTLKLLQLNRREETLK